MGLPERPKLVFGAMAAILAIAFGGVAGCTSRTLPLPPPEVRQVSAPDSQGYVTVTGRAREGASVGVLNDATQTGTIVTTLGSGCDGSCAFEARLEAESGDPIRVWQFFETESSIDQVVP